MTGVQSAQVLGPTTQKQADRSRASLDGDGPDPGPGTGTGTGTGAGTGTGSGSDDGTPSWSDGGREELERHNGVDVIR
jgi:cell division protein FtsZ